MNRPNSSVKNKNLIRSCEAAKILGVSREYVRQLVVAKILPPKYLFCANTWRKVYVFDKRLIKRFKDRKERKKIKWEDPQITQWVTAIEAAKAVKCNPDWIYNATKRGLLSPELVITSGMQQFRLYDIAAVAEARAKSAETRVPLGGHTPKTILMMEKIKQMNAEGINDSEIARRLKSTQPFISKLRAEMKLPSNAHKFHHRKRRKKGTIC